jgi:hypothetical protein
MTPVTDPTILAQLNGGGAQAVTDPAILAQLSGQSAPAAQQPSSIMDTIKGFGSGILQNLNPFLGNSGPLQTNENDPQYAASHLPQAETMSAVPGSTYQPQTTAGKYAKTIGQMAPTAAVPGSPLVRALRVVVPGIMSEAAGEATQGTSIEPYARAAGALAGGVGTGLGETLVAGVPDDSIAAVKQAASDAFQTVDNSGLRVKPEALQTLVSNIKSDLDDMGLNEKTMPVMAKKTFTALNYLQEAAQQPLSLQDLQMQRRIADLAYDPLNKTDTAGGYVIKDNIDNFIKNNLMDPSNLQGVPDTAAINALSDARGLWSKAAQAQTIQDTINKAAAQSKVGGSSVFSPTFEQSLRTKFGALAANQRGMAQFPSDVQDAIKDVATGGDIISARNVLRQIGQFAPSNVVPGVAGAYELTSHPEYALPLMIGAQGAKIGATALTKQAAQNALVTALRGQALPASTSQPGSAAMLATLLSQNNQGAQP